VTVVLLLLADPDILGVLRPTWSAR